MRLNEKSRVQKVVHTITAVVLSLITIFSTTVGAFAWTVDGSGIAGGGGGGKGFGIPGEFATTGSICKRYRFAF